MKKLLFILLFVLLAAQVVAQDNDLEVRINQIVDKDFPNIIVYVSVFNKTTQEPVTTVTTGNFITFVDSREENSKPKKEIFRIVEDPVSYYMVVDGNGVLMLDPEAMSSQKKAASAIAEKMQKDKDVFSAYLIEQEEHEIIKYAQDEDAIIEAFDEVDVVSAASPRLYDAVLDAVQAMDDEITVFDPPITRKVLILTTEGRDEGSLYNEDKFYDKVIEKNFPIYAIGFSITGGEYLNKLESLANSTGGNYTFAKSVKDIPRIVGIYHEQIMNCYILRYKVKAIKGDDDYHELKIGVKSPGGMTDSATKIFYARKGKFPVWLLILIIIIVLLLIAGLVLLIIFQLKKSRAKMGITNRRCPDCRRRMKDDWDECMFCKYLPPKKKKKKDD
jgi:hypothetical protein